MLNHFLVNEIKLTNYFRKIVNSGKLKQGCDAVAEAADDEPVHGGGVVDLWQVGSTFQRDC